MLLRVFLPFALGYYFSYLFRVVNTVIYRDLVVELSLPATMLGLLTAAYFVTFAACQLPLGLALDRFGPRRVNAVLLVCAGLGALAFSFGRTVEQLVGARALIGLGCSGALMAAITAYRLWYPLERLSRLNGWLLAIGGLGAMSATAPVELAMGFIGWRGVFQVLCALTFLLAGVILALVPERRAAEQPEGCGALLAGLRRVFRDSYFWSIAFLFMCASGGVLSFQTLWAAPWLRDVLGLARGEAAGYLLAMNFALVCGAAVFGRFADALERFGLGAPQLMMLSIALEAFALLAIAAGPLVLAIPAWLVVHFCASAASLGYAIMSRRYPKTLAGRTATSANMCVFIAAFALQYAIGAMLDWWPARAGGGYESRGYAIAIALVALLQAGAVLAYWRRHRAEAHERGSPA